MHEVYKSAFKQRQFENVVKKHAKIKIKRGGKHNTNIIHWPVNTTLTLSCKKNRIKI